MGSSAHGGARLIDRVAAIVRKVAKSYEKQAQQNEEQAERFRRGLEH